MVGNMYKVIRDYTPLKSNRDKGDFLHVEKGDILIDCEIVDDKWFRGKNMMSEMVGKVPKTHVEAFSSNQQETDTTYEDIDGDFSSPDVSQKLLIKKDNKVSSKPALTSNPLLDAVDQILNNSDQEYQDTSGSNLAKFREANYVEMSSGETINVEEEPKESTPLNAKTIKYKTVPPAKPQRSVTDVAKTSDDGYNSGSHYSGENNESSAPLLEKLDSCQQDEAGYEVPHQVLNLPTNNELNEEKPKDNKKLKMKFIKFRRKTSESKDKKDAKNLTQQEEDREKFYNPPIDHRDFYFLPSTEYPAIRILLSFIAALGLALGLFLVLYILGKLHAILCFTLASIVFVIVMLETSTLIKRGVLCVISLMLPSLASSRAKFGLIVLLIVFWICGPILGTVDKLNFSIDCHKESNNVGGSHRIRRQLQLRYPVETECITHLKRVNSYCKREWSTFRYNCGRYLTQKLLNKKERKLCLTDVNNFCRNDTIIEQFCRIKRKTGQINQSNTTFYSKQSSKYGSAATTNILRNVLLYLLPLLVLLAFSDAYRYNRQYLCTKNTDNIYITQRLRDLDCERKNRGLTDLIFPLTRIEFHTYLLRNTFTWSKVEKESVFKWLVVFVTSLLVTVGLVALENKIAALLVVALNENCSKLYDREIEENTKYRTIIYFLNGILLLIIFVQSHVLRARNMICEHFYPDMINIRSKHLYYKILHDRHTFARHIRRKIQLLAEEKRMARRISFKSRTYRVLPVKLQWLSLKLTIRRCMICDSISYRKTVECVENNCQAHYCYECYVDAGQQCLTCRSSSNNTTVEERAMSVAI